MQPLSGALQDVCELVETKAYALGMPSAVARLLGEYVSHLFLDNLHHYVHPNTQHIQSNLV